MTDADLTARYDARVPRYTSYPTAPHFHTGVESGVYADWLARLPGDTALSLYLHVPFCDRLCLYCGCHTSVARHAHPKRLYAQSLADEIKLLAAALGHRARVTQIHWGGGTPTSLPDDCLLMLMQALHASFDVASDAEIAIELDPTTLSASKLATLARMGLTRASLGVQDFAVDVQKAIGRMQSFEQTDDAAAALRALGVTSLNLDLIYGLPCQTEESVRRTARQALALQPDRAAVFGYAHVPWMKKHQALIPDSTLPGALERLRQERAIRTVLEQEGRLLPVGLDHYARMEDAMAKAALDGTLQRSFQGYTTDEAPILLGLGASAIGTLPQGYVQNQPRIPLYQEAIRQGRFAVSRGVALTIDDRVRRAVIERIMCDLAVDLSAVAGSFGVCAENLLADEAALADYKADGLVEWNGNNLLVTARGRPFVRNVAALFDAYLGQTQGNSARRHSRAV